MQTVSHTGTGLHATIVASELPQPVDHLSDHEWLELIGRCQSSLDVIRELLQRLSFEVGVAIHYSSAGDVANPIVRSILPIGAGANEAQLRILSAVGQSSLRSRAIEIRRLVSPDRTVVAMPLSSETASQDTLAWLLNGFPTEQEILAAAQLLSLRITVWHQLSRVRQLESEITDASAIIELMELVIESPTSQHAGYATVAALQAYLKSSTVVLGMRLGDNGPCKLKAVSGTANFAADSELAQSYESVLNEAILNNQALTWPTTQTQLASRTLEDLCAQNGYEQARAFPLRDKGGSTLGAILLLDKDLCLAPSETARFLLAAERPLATALLHTRQRRLLNLPSVKRTCRAWLKTVTGKTVAGVMVAMAIVLILPVPYQVHCPCQIEPIASRFVAAPFEGTLEKTLAKPGQIVKAGEVLARIDGREVQWKRTALAADLNQATKKRDAAQVSHSFAEQQIAQLEIQRLSAEIEVLDHRAANLEIASPVDGVIASGDLERVEGAPLQIGQTLFEIAPLDKMLVEMAIPDGEIARVVRGQPVQVRLDAFSTNTWKSQVDSIHPRAEIRDEANVFIAEAQFDNLDGKLRPGMKGRARIATDRRTIAWVLLHRPCEYLLKRLTW